MYLELIKPPLVILFLNLINIAIRGILDHTYNAIKLILFIKLPNPPDPSILSSLL